MMKETKNNKKVLIISFPFPPHGGSGVIRITKFVKYLPQFGWLPYILTVKDSFCMKDEELLDEISGKCKIIRTYHLDPRYIYRGGHSHSSATDYYETRDFLSHLKKFMSKIAIPDITIGWMPFAVLKGLNIIKKEKIDLLYSVGTPNSSHLIAFVLKKLTGKPWITDFKDPWINRFSYDIIPPFSIMDKYLEKLVIKSCNACITVTDFIKNGLSKYIWPMRNEKFHVISNGFDEEDFDNVNILPYRDQDNLCLKISHVGSLYSMESPICLFESIYELINERKIKLKEIKLIFVGNIDNKSLNNFYFKKLLNLEVVEFHGFVSHKRSIKYILESDLLLLVIDKIVGSKNIPTSKIFEYLASGRPILALTASDSIAARLIKKANSGYIVGFTDKNSIKNNLLEILNKYKKNNLDINQNKKVLTNYKRKFLTEKLANIFNNTFMSQ